jgi:hypothetical protein
MVAGQFSIFGAVEEKDRHGFSRIGRHEETDQGLVVGPLNGGRSCASGDESGKSGRVSSRIVHRVCTGNAESQLPVFGNQESVLAARA